MKNQRSQTLLFTTTRESRLPSVDKYKLFYCIQGVPLAFKIVMQRAEKYAWLETLETTPDATPVALYINCRFDKYCQARIKLM